MSAEIKEARAQARYLRFSASKGRLVADLIRGKSVEEALVILRYCKRAAAKSTMKVLRSAIANAQDNRKMDTEQLYVKAVAFDDGPSMKRVLPRARGRADRILKRMCHATVVLGERG